MNVDKLGEVTIVTIPVRIDTINAADVEAHFKQMLATGVRRIVADFGGNEYVSSAGLRVFLATLKSLQKDDGRIVLCAMTPFVLDVFEISGFSQLFEIVDTRAAALAGFA
jgi:anti-anti-sigma factor